MMDWYIEFMTNTGLRLWYDFRIKMGRKPWFHTPTPCFKHVIPMWHKVDYMSGGADKNSIMVLCSNGIGPLMEFDYGVRNG